MKIFALIVALLMSTVTNTKCDEIYAEILVSAYSDMANNACLDSIH